MASASVGIRARLQSCITIFHKRSAFSLGTVESWFRETIEIFVLIRYSHAAGSKNFGFFSSFTTFSEMFNALPPSASVTTFKTSQLQLGGVVDDRFISECLAAIPDGTEFLLLKTENGTMNNNSGETHAELHEALDLCTDYRLSLAGILLLGEWSRRYWCICSR
ncbi:MAG TPA: hypothetical protein VHA06_01895 [Candidatus Angelobacter sp.]|jgi:hypothetical protein|nr:hypothetical protein [Candidatus Angelobacter sp.]